MDLYTSAQMAALSAHSGFFTWLVPADTAGANPSPIKSVATGRVTNSRLMSCSFLALPVGRSITDPGRYRGDDHGLARATGIRQGCERSGGIEVDRVRIEVDRVGLADDGESALTITLLIASTQPRGNRGVVWR